ncbi:hypothetical protein [Streptomyces indiaensis]|uniref:Uncharacterized protein n=1 Tax=Streptomyces indiaensis TaxID=284033 RepID=A0ABP5QU71_9ACTN|nr:hypothetical protein [Streptomyces indiaensis]MCF1646486.1 hypothetical protein [Streptomyces indiaensis]
MRTRVFATSAALLLSLAAALLVGDESAIDWPTGGERTVQAQTQPLGLDGGIDWP